MDLRDDLIKKSEEYMEHLKSKEYYKYYLDATKLILEGGLGEDIDRRVKINDKDTVPLENSLEAIWNEKWWHTLITGDWGMGKTVALFKLWNKFLDRSKGDKVPIPLFLSLCNYEYIPQIEKCDNYLLRTITKIYLGEGHNEHSIWNIIKEPIKAGDRTIPSVILLLDGFEQLSGDNINIVNELHNLMKNAKGLQLVISSESDIRESYNWNDLNKLELAKLDEAQVKQYLNKYNIAGDLLHKLMDVVRVPLMLKLYVATSIVIHDNPVGEEKFIKNPQTKGEILWNYVSCVVFRAYQQGLIEVGDFLQDKLPLLRYEMRFEGKDNKEKILAFAHEHREYACLVQQYYDLFVIIYIINQITDGVMHKKIAEVLVRKVIPSYLRAQIGEIAGEYNNVPEKQGSEWSMSRYTETILCKTLHLCRGIFNESIVGFAVWNIIEIWKMVRGELTGEDFSNLYLLRANFNMAICSRWYGQSYTVAKFDKSLINAKNILFERGHSKGVNSVVLSNNSDYILSASEDCTIKLWFRRTGECITTYEGHTGSVRSAVFSSKEDKILSASWDGTIKEWNAKTGKCIKTYGSVELNGCSRSVELNGCLNSAVYSVDECKILSASSDYTVKEWSTETGECLKIYKEHTDCVRSAIYNVNSTKILSASWDGTIKEWDLNTYVCKTLVRQKGRFNSAVYSYNCSGSEKILATLELLEKPNKPKFIIREYTTDGSKIKDYEGHKQQVRSAIYIEDGKRILSTSNDTTIKEWDANTGICIRTYLGHGKSVNSVACYKEKNIIVSASTDETVKQWLTKTGKCITTYGHSSGDHDCRESYESVITAVYNKHNTRILFSSIDKTIKEWDIENDKCIKIYSGHEAGVQDAVYNSDESKILSSAYRPDMTVKEWNSDTGECIATFKGHTDSVNSAVYSNDESKVLSASSDGTMKEWDVKTKKCLANYNYLNKIRRGNEFSSAIYNEDGTMILSSLWDFTVRVWDVSSRQNIETYQFNDPYRKKPYLDTKSRIVYSAVYNKDGKKILAAASYYPSHKTVREAGPTIKEWDINEIDRGVKEFRGHNADVVSAIYSNNGENILSASVDKTIKEWDVKTTKCLKTYKGHTKSVNSAVYSKDGQKILSASDDGTVKVWDVGNEKCICTIPNKPGLIIQECHFFDLHGKSDIAKEGEARELLKKYGARFDNN